MCTSQFFLTGLMSSPQARIDLFGQRYQGPACNTGLGGRADEYKIGLPITVCHR